VNMLRAGKAAHTVAPIVTGCWSQRCSQPRSLARCAGRVLVSPQRRTEASKASSALCVAQTTLCNAATRTARYRWYCPPIRGSLTRSNFASRPKHRTAHCAYVLPLTTVLLFRFSALQLSLLLIHRKLSTWVIECYSAHQSGHRDSAREHLSITKQYGSYIINGYKYYL
jgi:hypothetical protein